jgi:Gpi18-like mannosyltransferase
MTLTLPGLDIIEWFAAICAAIAALMVSLDLGRRMTGFAFILFTFSSLGFIAYGVMDPEPEGAIAALNFVLLLINLNGIYRYLIRKKPPGQST